MHAKNRARGIKASPAKLRAAQHESGFKSQTEIAVEIQRLENLDSPPRTMVGRVFRGEAVDPISLERVAKALKVESWSIYLDSVEAEHIQANEAVTADQESRTITPYSISVPEKKSVTFWLFTGIKSKAVIAIVFLGAMYFYSSLEQSADSPVLQQAPINFDNKVIVVLPFDGPRGKDITQQLQQTISTKFSWVARTAKFAAVANPLDLVRQHKADLVLSGKTEQIGRNVILQVFATEGSTSRQIWADTFSHAASKEFIQFKINQWLSLIKQQKQLNSPSWDVLQSYLKGVQYLDGDRATEVLLRAIVELGSVVRLAPDFAKGHAALCVALYEYGHLTGDQDKLAEAKIPCEKSLALAPDEIEVKISNANLARKQGEFEHAQQLFEGILTLDTNSVEAMRGLAEILMRSYLKQPNDALFERTESLLQKALEIEPDNWKVPYTLARLYYFTGKQTQAIAQFTLASEIYPSYQTYFNLGTVEFCVGDLAKAKEHYQAALVFQPDESALQSNIATLYQYLGEPEKALTIYQSLLDKLNDYGADNLYHVWASMGEIFRRLGLKQKAVEAYRNGLLVLENEIAKGEGNVQQKTLRLVLYLTLAKLEPENYSDQFKTQLRQQAEEYADVVDPVSVFQMTNVWLLFGELERARAMRDKLAASCPGYTASPDFSVL
ncbi:MAG: hypothetical protein NWQ54_13780 [Paraglaciecola sp.]|nr:hypothetical protein [Paraglaciecola sp.]